MAEGVVAAAAPWDVHRRWVTRFGRETVRRRMGRRLRRRPDPGGGADAATGIGGLDDLLVSIVLVVVVFVLVVFVFPLVFIVVEVLVLGLVAVGGAVARTVLRRPWTVDAVGSDGTHLRWQVVGWRAASAKIDEVRSALARGVVAPGAVVVHDRGITTQPPPEWSDPAGGR